MESLIRHLCEVELAIKKKTPPVIVSVKLPTGRTVNAPVINTP
jgi:hypothetical protein